MNHPGQAALEAEVRARAAAENAARAAEGKGPKHADLDPVRVHTVRPEPKAQRHFTDPDSRIRPASNKGWDQSGNAQVLVDESQLILAADVTQQANDVQQVAPLLDQMKANLQAAEITPRPQEFVGDAGDDSDDNTQCVVSHEMVPYLATQRLKHHEELPPVPRGRIPKSLTPKPRLARTLRTSQCMTGRRIGELTTLQREIKIWADKTNAKQRGVDWQFKITDARRKLKRLYPVIKTG